MELLYGGTQKLAIKLKNPPSIDNPCMPVSPWAALLSTFATGTAIPTTVGGGVGEGVGRGVGRHVGLGVVNFLRR